MANIHPTAIIEPGAQLDENVTVGAYAYIGPEVTLGAGTVIHHHACVEGYTFLGRDNEVYPFAVIGGKTQDLKYKGGRVGLKIGDRNCFREYVTIHGGTQDGQFTTLGNDNNILAYSHVAHDCQIGNFLVMSSQAAFAGHVVCGDHVNFGWGTGIHQFCRIGDYSMLAAMSRIVKDVPPYMIVEGTENCGVKAFNLVAMKRNGFSEEDIRAVRQAWRVLYFKDLNQSQAHELLATMPEGQNPCVRQLIEFQRSSERGSF
ncbi:MAG: acyl-ACP--UDP-N-acetylglucosamine O-acyltransferase [Opitutales bacterium]|nr:acyl-ACP--UDP-N-acetylglucosamine O-acyltransferase [Opitutales bacterium]